MNATLRPSGAAWTAPDEDARPILVFGAQRSGTTLLNAVLNNHPALGLTYTHLHYWAEHYRAHDPLDAGAVERLLARVAAFRVRNAASFDEAVAARARAAIGARPLTYAHVWEALVRAIVNRPVERFGETYPGDGREVAFFLEAFPRGQVIFIHRDPRDVFLSERARLARMNPASLAQGGHLVNASAWRTAARIAREAGRALGPDRFLSVAFADLVGASDATAERLCAFLGLPFAPAMLAVPAFRDDDGRAWESNSSFEPVRHIDARTLGRWREKLAPDEVALVEHLAGEDLERLGYARAGTADAPELRDAVAAAPELRDAVAAALRTLARQLELLPAASRRPFVPRAVQDALGSLGDPALPVVIEGDGERAMLAAEAARSLGRPVRAFAVPPERAGLAADAPLVAAAALTGALAGGLVRTGEGEGFSGATAPCLDLTALEPASPLALLTHGVMRTLPTGPHLALTQPDFAALAGWSVLGEGARAAIARADWPPHATCGELSSAGPTASFYQVVAHAGPGAEVVAGAWVRAGAPEVARVQLVAPGVEVASPCHPGDGRFRFLWVRARLAPDAAGLQLYLQLVGAGAAAFTGAFVAPVLPAPTSGR